jgi:hypothetical protein
MATCLRPPFKLPDFIEATGIAKIRQVGQFSPTKKGFQTKHVEFQPRKNNWISSLKLGFQGTKYGFIHGSKIFL